MTFGAFPDIEEDGEDELDSEDALALDAISNAQFLFDAHWSHTPPWVLANVHPELVGGQMAVWQAWIRVVRSTQIEADNYHRSKQAKGLGRS